MPTYDFECPKCMGRTEVVRSITQSGSIGPLCFVQGCDGLQMERVIGATSFVLKGTGWARDGYSAGGAE